MVDGRVFENSECDESQVFETNQLLNTLGINILVGFLLVVAFEVNRKMKSIYMKRLTKDKLYKHKPPRTPEEPPETFLGWIGTLNAVTEDDILRMVGLDGYMLIRYINICFRISLFITFWGLVVLVPVYANSGGNSCAWNKFTLSNVPQGDIDNTDSISELWIPALFAYLFAGYICAVMYTEYQNFLEKRVAYLQKGDPDTPPQAVHTVMVEKIPAPLRTTQALADFFDNMFPGEVYSIQIACDLSQLDNMIAERRRTRDALEKAIAIKEATQKRPHVWIASDENDLNLIPVDENNSIANALGFVILDSIEYYHKMLQNLNEGVLQRQVKFVNEQVHVKLPTHRPGTRADSVQEHETGSKGHSLETQRLLEGNDNTANGNGSNDVVGSTSDKNTTSNGSNTDMNNKGSSDSLPASTSTKSKSTKGGSSNGTANGTSNSTKQRTSNGSATSSKSNSSSSSSSNKKGGGSYDNLIPEKLAQEAGRTAEDVAKGALRGVLEATRTLELLTVGANYKTSSTAFVTLLSRVASCMGHQTILSHRHYSMTVKVAPNPKDIRWENVMIPQRQIDMRRTIADVTLVIGALFWSLVIGFITTISNLENLSRVYGWLQEYSTTFIYQFFNAYLASGFLLALLSLLPIIFDIIARNYEGLKLESEIQNSIMTRYFYYQLANVFVSVYAGSIITALHQILDSPSNILSILGSTLPSFSIYFANLVIVKTFTAVPIEMLRLWPLFQILTWNYVLDKKRCTARELQAGAFSDPPMLYGWIYPSLMMVLMIVMTYSCISPVIAPLGMLYFAAAYGMYKYQLLYVFINEYQSGGFMWYAVFNRSMIALICAATTLTCYLGFRRSFFYGPFYFTLPLPFLIAYFWLHCENRFKETSLSLSLESAIELDRRTYAKRMAGYPSHPTFNPKLFRQPSLAEGPLRPAPYRPTVINSLKSRRRSSATSSEQESFFFSSSTNTNMELGRHTEAFSFTSSIKRIFGSNSKEDSVPHTIIGPDGTVQTTRSTYEYSTLSGESGHGPLSPLGADTDAGLEPMGMGVGGLGRTSPSHNSRISPSHHHTVDDSIMNYHNYRTHASTNSNNSGDLELGALPPPHLRHASTTGNGNEKGSIVEADTYQSSSASSNVYNNIYTWRDHDGYGLGDGSPVGGLEHGTGDTSVDHHEYVPENVDLEQHAHLQDVCEILEFPLSPMRDGQTDGEQADDNSIDYQQRQERLYTVRQGRGAGDDEDGYSPLRHPEAHGAMSGTEGTPLQPSNGNGSYGGT